MENIINELNELIREMKFKSSSTTKEQYYNKVLGLIGNNHNGTYYNNTVEEVVLILKTESKENKNIDFQHTVFEILIELFYFGPEVPNKTLNDKIMLLIYEFKNQNINFSEYVKRSNIDMERVLIELGVKK